MPEASLQAREKLGILRIPDLRLTWLLWAACSSSYSYK